MYRKDLALNNLQWLICHKTKPNQTSHIYTNAEKFRRTYLSKLIQKRKRKLSDPFGFFRLHVFAFCLFGICLFLFFFVFLLCLFFVFLFFWGGGCINLF